MPSESADCPQRDSFQLHLHVSLINENQNLFREGQDISSNSRHNK
jgi:hypothetical protein